MPDKSPEDLAEELINEVEQDMSTDDLTRGTEVYEEIDEEVDDLGDPEALDFEPEPYDNHIGYDYSETADAYVDGYDD